MCYPINTENHLKNSKCIYEFQNFKISDMNLEREPMEVPVVGGAKPKPTASSASGSKKRSPKSPRKSRPNPEMQSSQDTALPPEKPREKRHHKEKRSHRGKQQQQPEQDPNAPSGGAASAGNGSKSKTGDKPPRTRVRQGSQRQSIRRQSQVEHPHDQQHGGRDHRDQRGGDISVSGRKSKIPEEMSGAGGGVISGAELSDVFDEESQHQYYPEDSDIKYMEDRSNCRKK